MPLSRYFTQNYQRAFGTFPLKDDALRDALSTAIDVGYRAIDTAQFYENEAEVGETIAHAGIPRDAFCITTKVKPQNFAEADFIPSVEQSLKHLRLDEVDVLLLHWPTPGGDIAASLRLLEAAQRQGLTRHIGVSNYTGAMLRQAQTVIDTPIITNQVEFHPLLDQSRLLQAANETGIPLSAYCSVARGAVFKHRLFDELAQVYGKTPGQIVLRWILQQGVSINTMSTRRANIEANYNIMDFTLSSPDMARISALTATGLRIVNHDKVPWAPDWD